MHLPASNDRTTQNHRMLAAYPVDRDGHDCRRAWRALVGLLGDDKVRAGVAQVNLSFSDEKV